MYKAKDLDINPHIYTRNFLIFTFYFRCLNDILTKSPIQVVLSERKSYDA